MVFKIAANIKKTANRGHTFNCIPINARIGKTLTRINIYIKWPRGDMRRINSPQSKFSKSNKISRFQTSSTIVLSKSRKIRAERSSRGGEIILTDLAVRRTLYFFLVLMRRVREGGGGEEGRVRAAQKSFGFPARGGRDQLLLTQYKKRKRGPLSIYGQLTSGKGEIMKILQSLI